MDRILAVGSAPVPVAARKVQPHSLATVMSVRNRATVRLPVMAVTPLVTCCNTGIR